MTNWKVVDQSEIDDCYTEIEKLGLKREDFTFGDEEDLTKYCKHTPDGSAMGILKGTILASRLSTGKQKRYDTGPKQPWAYYFSLDLKNSYFD